ncbi:MAG: ABC transporter ATP-binding protein [Desulfobacterota bacterium]|nr:ABC transporter ATP-binding protein [Thermodesulfobacteriota bacterium]MDW8002327.1 ABC transporter ATP-binding protein [Deltaproteobacteria bacterium]
MIEFRNVTFYYERQKILFKNFSLFVERGESLAVLGPSGCGKTTFLYLVAGLLEPKEGEIIIGNQRLKGPREKTALILQDYGLLPWKTIKENVELGLKFRKPSSDNLSDYWIRRLNLSDVKDKYPHQVSGGQKQRAAIARSLVLKPDLILMDEPFSSLDAPTRESLQDLILDLKRDENLTIILVTHTIEEAVYVGRKILILLDPPHTNPPIIVNEEKTIRRNDETFTSLCLKLRDHIGKLWNRRD